MNNLNYYSFERNNYYSGKVLSAGNFEMEQRYANDKRRLINRFVEGAGVVCGLDVVAVSEDTISVEPGIALDGSGREIVVEAPDVKKLSALQGYETGKTQGDSYLYITYEEAQTDEVKLSGNDQSMYMNDKIKEQYNLYLSNIPPQYDMGMPEYYYRHSEVVFKNPNMEIIFCAPKYIKTTEKFLVEYKIIPKDISESIQVSFRTSLECVRYKNKDYIDIDFDSRTCKAQEGEYTLTFLCEGMDVVLDMAVFTVLQDRMTIKYGDEDYFILSNVSIESVMTAQPVEQKVLEEYQTSFMGYMKNRPFVDICIARISMKYGKISNIGLPYFYTEVASNMKLAIENMILKEKMQILALYGGTDRNISDEKQSFSDFEISSGETVLNLGIGGKAGKRFFSEEIVHGLGIGNVTVVAGICDHEQQGVVYGSSEIFDEEQKGIKAETAVKVNPAKGTFVIGARLLESTSEYEVVVHWTAFRRKENYKQEQGRRIIIEQGMKSLRVMESFYFTVKFINMPKCSLHWSVDGENAGSINENGYYTAPNQQGVYRICVECLGMPEISASAYVVVKP